MRVVRARAKRLCRGSLRAAWIEISRHAVVRYGAKVAAPCEPRGLKLLRHVGVHRALASRLPASRVD